MTAKINKEIWGIHDFVANNIAHRLLLPTITAKNILIVGADGNISFQILKNRYPQAIITELDEQQERLALSLLQRKKNRSIKEKLFKLKHQQRLQALDQAIATAEFDLLMANLSLNHYQAPFTTIFKQWSNALKANAMIFFSCLGPDSLKEIKVLLQANNQAVNITSIADMHDIGDELLQHHFIDPVVDMDMLTLSYKNPETFWVDMKSLNLTQQLLIKPEIKATIDHAILTGKVNKITLEIIYGHAIKKIVLPENETILQFYQTKPKYN